MHSPAKSLWDISIVEGEASVGGGRASLPLRIIFIAAGLGIGFGQAGQAMRALFVYEPSRPIWEFIGVGLIALTIPCSLIAIAFPRIAGGMFLLTAAFSVVAVLQATDGNVETIAAYLLRVTGPDVVLGVGLLVVSRQYFGDRRTPPKTPV